MNAPRNTKTHHEALLPPLPYQRAYIEDAARFKIWLASRQVGKSWAAALEAVVDCFRKPSAHWVILSAGERQALEFIPLALKSHAKSARFQAFAGWRLGRIIHSWSLHAVVRRR